MEQLTLQATAQALMDMYYREFKAEGEFFEFEFFELVCRAIYAKLLENDAKDWRRVAKAETGFYVAEVNNEWLVEEEVAVEVKEVNGEKRTVGKLTDLPFSFGFDKWGWGIQDVYSPDILKLERTTFDKVRELRHMPNSGVVFWYPLRETISILCIREELKKVYVRYVPSLTNKNASEAFIPVGKQLDILTMGYQVMSAVKNGVIDTTNNGNNNSTIQTEVDNVFSNTRVKPV